MSGLACVPSLSSELRPQFRLRPGRDDALIGWLASMRPRQRSDAIRSALWSYLGGGQAHVDALTGGEDPDLAAALDALF